MSEAPRRYLRFRWPDRAEHIVLLTCFTILAITGLAQKFAEGGLSQAIIAALGGIETTRRIHHAAAVVLMLEAIFHLGSVSYRVFVRRTRLDMLPGVVDARSAWWAFLYNLGLRREPPQEGRYGFAEKAEYWAVVWGTALMALTGFMMWNPISTTRYLPGQMIPAAKAAHGYEAIMAVLAIIVWHMYHVHLRRFNKSMFTGHLNEHEMIEEHPLELADLKAGLAERPVDPKGLARRRRIFFPIYAVVAALLLAGVYAFVTFEQTAITTLPAPVEVPIYLPLTATPLPTRAPTATAPPAATATPTLAGATAEPTTEGATAPATAAAGPTWGSDIGPLLAASCATCHGAGGGMAGLDLTSYGAALQGATSGPVIVPGDPAGSLLVQKQQAGGHPGQLTAEQLELVISWIQAGAPE
ncbi:MAG TPA: cytochrome b/b6 domain-containing protein [Anaerolineales bacterium]|nr:cytochrome b/b6 domain-containing protein [Anaerolineales bacterium]